MKAFRQWVGVVAVSMTLAGTAVATQPFVYPQKGQSPDQQKKDSYECDKWAKTQSGVDPAQAPPPAQPGQHARGAVRGGARGAAAGAAVGAIAGDAGKGAAAGAVVGGVRGRRQSKAAQQGHQQAAGDAYNRAFAACMSGRGYSVR